MLKYEFVCSVARYFFLRYELKRDGFKYYHKRKYLKNLVLNTKVELDKFIDRIFNIKNEDEFNAMALELFRFQAREIPLYKKFLSLLNVDVDSITAIESIPFLPLSLFKRHQILQEGKKEAIIFSSSGTTGMVQSKHYVADLGVYERSFMDAFELFYGSVEEYTVLALLPSYLEREGSSLIYMVDALIQKSNSADSGFYLDELEVLAQKLKALEAQKKKVLLIGVSYALLDLIERFDFQLKHTIVMETGGMKGKRKEMIKSELHAVLQQGFGVEHIHSEYGMTELLSQAYSKKNQRFECPPWMKILIRDPNDPLCMLDIGQGGGISVVDLANVHSCAFLATQDLGKVYSDGTFEVLGRFDHSDIRGCNLLVQ